MSLNQHEMLDLRPETSYKLGNVLVLGLGKSGKAAVEYCLSLLGTRVESVFVAAGQENDTVRAYLNDLAQSCVVAATLDRSDDAACGCSDDAVSDCSDVAACGLSNDGAACEPSDDGAYDRFAYAFGDDGVPSDRSFDICIASPGIPFWHQLYQEGEKASNLLVSEMEFAWRESKPDSIWIAITGTNGKTTTTALCAHILKECGYKAAAVGNIGDVCLKAVADGGTQVYVTEVSSYQLASTVSFSPQVAVILNITPDHLHWHQSLEAYRDAKFKVLENLGVSTRERLAVAVLNATDDVVREKVRELRPLSDEERGFAYIPLGTADGIRGDMRMKCGAENAAFLSASNNLVVALAGDEYDLCSAYDLQIPGEHNVSNALAAASAALAIGAPAQKVAAALKSFAPLEHRIEPCGEHDGVLYVNDSKGTNVDSVLKALGAFPQREIIILLGGEDKGTDLSPLVRAAHEHARLAICYGEAGPRFTEAFAALQGEAPRSFKYMDAKHMADAFEAAVKLAKPGDVVLLSPACASFDEFGCFEERGHVFKQMVTRLMKNEDDVGDGNGNGNGNARG